MESGTPTLTNPNDVRPLPFFLPIKPPQPLRIGNKTEKTRHCPSQLPLCCVVKLPSRVVKTPGAGSRMREQEGACEAGRRGGGVIRSLLGVDSPPAEDVVVVAVAPEEDGGSTKKKKAEAVDGEQRKAVVRVVAADMPAALQRRAFRCARDELASMPHFPRRLEPKRLALALKKVISTNSHRAPRYCRSWFRRFLPQNVPSVLLF